MREAGMKVKSWFFDCDGTLVDSEILAMGVAIDILADATQKIKPETVIDRPQLVQDYAGWQTWSNIVIHICTQESGDHWISHSFIHIAIPDKIRKIG